LRRPSLDDGFLALTGHTTTFGADATDEADGTDRSDDTTAEASR
jgi:hypothetical protein